MRGKVKKQADCWPRRSSDSVERASRQLIYKLNHDPTLHLECYKTSNEDISFYSGFPTYKHVLACFDLPEENAEEIDYGTESKNTNERPKTIGRWRKLSKWQEFTMVLLRLRLGLLERDLAHRFTVSVSTVSGILSSWIRFIRAELEPLCTHWPTKQHIKSFMPKHFQKLCSELVSIIDCTEIRMDSPSSLDKKQPVTQATSHIPQWRHL